MLKVMKGLEINAKQIERVCHYYGGKSEEADKEMLATQIYHTYNHKESNQLHCAMVDFLTQLANFSTTKKTSIF